MAFVSSKYFRFVFTRSTAQGVGGFRVHALISKISFPHQPQHQPYPWCRQGGSDLELVIRACSAVALSMASDDEAGTTSTAASRRTRTSSVVAGGPVVVYGKVFTMVKRCPFCLLKNCDDNPIRKGPWGFQTYTFLIWDRGTAEAPVGRFCRICTLVWVQAGFDTEYQHGGPDEFLEKRKSEPNRQTEFDAARTPRIQIATLKNCYYRCRLKN